MTNTKNIKLAGLMVLLTVIALACSKNLPDDLDVFGNDTRFTQTIYRPILGRNTLMNNNFTPGNSTRPFNMKIINMVRADGSPAPELKENFPVTVWKEAYTGLEKSLQEIEAKRKIEYYPLFTIGQHSGEMWMWAKANSSFVSCEPDSGYRFDVEVENSGGRRYFRNMRLIPKREIPYEPSIYDPLTGVAPNSFTRPISVTNFRSEGNRFEMGINDVKIFFNKNTEPNAGRSLTFRFFDSNYVPIDPAKFNQTNWAALVHGFNMEKTATYVKYDVAYPIPLTISNTKYTNLAGNLAHTQFTYDRINSGGFREVANMVFDFAIYEEGAWEIVIVFADRPRFEND